VNVATVEKLAGLRFPEAREPYRDRRPLKLIIERVQVADVEALSAADSMNAREETGETVAFSNMILTVAEEASGNQPMAGGSELQLSLPSETSPFATTARSGPQEQYTHDLKKYFGYYATWNPGLPLKLGDIGLLKGDVFRKIGELGQRGITFSEQLDSTPTDLKYTSRGSVVLTTKLAGAASLPGSALAGGDAGIVVEFTKENAVLFQANQTLTHFIADTISLGETVLALFREGKWDKHWAVITELVVADAATILISNAKGAKIELKANANINAPSIDIADAQFAFSAQSSKSLETEIIARKGITPLFRIMGIKTALFQSPEFTAQGLSPLDFLTPEAAASTQNKGKISFGYLSENLRE
jgi:hypothetical protein